MRKSDLKKHWDALFERIWNFPPWMRNIILEDINGTIKNRVSLFEMIERKIRG
jgi:hypothetical protein